MNIFIVVPQTESMNFGLPIGVYSSRELALKAITNDYVQRFPSIYIQNILSMEAENVEVLSFVNQEQIAVINYNIIVKSLDDLPFDDALIESPLIS